MIEISNQTVIDMIHHTKVIQQIPSPTFFEKKRAEYISSQFKKIGLLEIQTDPTGNVLGKIRGSGLKPLIISAHLDSVFSMETKLEQFSTEQSITGPGIGDNALGLAGLLTLSKLILESKHLPLGDIWFIANTCEEGLGNLKGMHAIVDKFAAQPIGYLILEGIGLGMIQTGALGVNRLRIKVSTKGGHAWNDYGGSSAIHELVKIAASISSMNLPETPRTTLNIGTISGGESINAIASSAQMEIDIRSEDAEILLSMIGILNKKIKPFQTKAVKVEVSDIGSRPYGKINPNHPFIQRAKKALEFIGIPPIEHTSSTDASLPISLGYPATCLGITTGADVHSVHEQIFLPLIGTGLKQILNFIEAAW
jgi:tripeptide aminopeptidase